MNNSTQQKFNTFCKLHDEIFVIPNPWDAGSARILSAMGYTALATTSAGYAFSVGKRDSDAGLSRDEILINAKAIVEATDLPVSADLENGFGAAPETCATTIIEASRIGLVGGSIEDATGDSDAPIYEFEAALDRVAAACEAARDLPFLITARAENYLHGCADLDDTIKRLVAFEAAGADVLYAPGLPDLNAISEVCSSLSKPVNVVMGLSGPTYSLEQLKQAGVKRVSVGGSFARAAIGGFMRAAEEVLTHGTFGYAKDAIPDATIREYMAGQLPK